MNGKSLADVAKKSGVSYPWLRRVSSRGLPRPCKWSSPNLEKLADYFETDVALLWRNNSKLKTFRKMIGNPSPRVPGDSFSTPKVAVDALLGVVKFGKLILEPCCGTGSISKVLTERGYDVISRDLYDWGFGEVGEDFLVDEVKSVDAVVTNPPFTHGTQFALKALECTKARRGKVAILNRLLWMEGKKRKKLFTEYPLSNVLVFSERLERMNRPDYKGKSSKSLLAFAWFIWDWKYEGEPRLAWI